MSTQLKITAQPRQALGRNAVKNIKKAGYIPGVIYGAKQEPQPVQFQSKDVAYLLSHAASESILVEVNIEGQIRSALLQEVQHHPVTDKVLHLDLHAVSMDEVITAEIPIESTGEPVGVKTAGGVLEQSLRTLEIECLPGNLPDVITVDVSGIELNAALHVRDLKLPQGVTATNDPELTVFAVATPTVVEASTALEATPAEPEVITAKKPAEETEGAAGNSEKK